MYLLNISIGVTGKISSKNHSSLVRSFSFNIHITDEKEDPEDNPEQIFLHEEDDIDSDEEDDDVPEVKDPFGPIKDEKGRAVGSILDTYIIARIELEGDLDWCVARVLERPSKNTIKVQW